jgi:predicted nucleic acid-binding protein
MDFFDTNILVYMVDPTDPRRQQIARSRVRDALASDGFVLSAQVMQEFYNTVVRRQLLDHETAEQMLRDWAHERVVNTTPDLLWGALEIRKQRQFSIWDALIVQAALEAGCTRLITQDLQHGQRLGDLEIVDPFQAAETVHEPAPPYRARGRRR